jgi:4-hydroxy-tetrahydrodipicolinate synthase
MRTAKLKGIFVSTITPMDEEGDVDLPMLKRWTDHLITDGEVHGLVACDSAGEFATLERDERREVVDAVLAAAKGRVPVIVGVSHAATRAVLRFAEHAEKAGATALLLTPPIFMLPTHAEVIAHYEAVHDATSLPIVLYNTPGRTGVDLTPDLVAKLAELDRVIAIKESSGHIGRISHIKQLVGEKLEVWCGMDEQAFENFAWGNKTWISGSANLLPRLHVQLFRSMVEEESLRDGRAIAHSLLPVFRLLESGGAYTQCIKLGCAMMGWKMGLPRPPLRAPSRDQEALLRAMLDMLRPFEVEKVRE